MKTTIYELLGMIKNNNAAKKILFDNQIWNYRARTDMEGTILFEEYINEETDEDLFDEYLILDILSNEVEILETTITYKPDKIEKIKLDVFEGRPFVGEDEIIAKKVNEIIDRINNE